MHDTDEIEAGPAAGRSGSRRAATGALSRSAKAKAAWARATATPDTGRPSAGKVAETTPARVTAGAVPVDAPAPDRVVTGPGDDRDGSARAVGERFVADAAVGEPVVGETAGPTGEAGLAAGTSPSARRVRRTVPAGLAWGLAALGVGLAVALVFALLALGNQHQLDQARVAALSAARADAVALAAYDYRHLGHDFAVVEADSTPSYRHTYEQASGSLRSTLVRYRASASARVVSAGLVSATNARAVALVLLDQKVSNSEQSAATSERSQVEVTLVRSGGRWLIDQVTLL